MSAIATTQIFSAVHTVGGLLPADWLTRVADGKDVLGSKPADYRVIGARSVRDDAERRWDYLRAIWQDLRGKLPPAPEAETPVDTTGIAITQWLLPLFAELGFGELTAIGAAGIPADDGTKTFPVSHRWNHVPIHLAPWQSILDRRHAGTVPPQSLVQECLNRADSHLWAVLTNGRQLRLLRDSSALATSSYVEFDLEAIFDGELFSEFVLLYRLLHVTRFAVADGAPATSCWLEKWRGEAIKSGTRALDSLRDGVRDAITTLGTGFLKHPDNTKLREHTDTQALHTALLRLVYRMLFLFVIEDRDVLHPPKTPDQTRERYATYFSTAKLRDNARRRRGTAHHDRYQALRSVLDALGDEHGHPKLGLPGLGGIFDHTDTILDGLALSNEHLFTAVRHLAQVRDSGRWRSVDYRHLDAEELGSIYESLLETVPKHSAVDRAFELVEVAGNERKTTGSYYTPSSLIERLLNTTLDPVIDDAVKRGEQKSTAVDPTDAIVNELLSLTVCDPACGSGHFLVAAARRIAKRVAAIRERNPEPTLDTVRHALHEVIARCIYGVDLNPMAIELAKVSLWLEAMDPGTPLSFLDAHLKVGNALIGATPTLLSAGIPDEAFIATEGDDRKYAKTIEKINADERHGKFGLFDIEQDAVKITNTAFADHARRIATAPADNLKDVRKQASAYASWAKSSDYVNALHVADAWCSAFMWIKSATSPRPVTHDVFRSLDDPAGTGASQATHNEIARLRTQYHFFHWHLEFPEVFSVLDNGHGVSGSTGWAGGFDCVLANPPWDSVELKEQEFFAQRSPTIAAVGKADARKKLIAKLRNDPDTQTLFTEYADAKRKVYAESHFLRRSSRVPLTGQGNLNTYAVFSETARILTGARGRAGVIVPTGIATDARTQYFFKDLVKHGSLTALYDFENRNSLFPDVDSRMKFCVLSIAGSAFREPAAKFAFFLHDPAELDDANRLFPLTPEEITLLNPNTGTCAIFRSRRDAEITLNIHRHVPVLIKEPNEQGQGGSNPWAVSFMTMFHMSHDSRFFHTREDLEADDWVLNQNVFTRGKARMLPLYEAKMLHHYDHRWSTYDEDSNIHDFTPEQKRDARVVVLPRYWAPEDDVLTGMLDKDDHEITEAGVATRLASKGWHRKWIIGFRKICRATDERTLISYAFPVGGLGDSGNIILPSPDEPAELLYSNITSLAMDYILRQKLGGTNLNFFQFAQLPILRPQSLQVHRRFIGARTLELAYTAYDMTSFARDVGDIGAPFRWNEGRRTVIRSELDALFFHLYGITRDDTDYILDTFPIVKRKDEAKYGTYRTKDLILAEYDRMTAAGVSLTNPLVDGENYSSTLDPAPGYGPRHPEESES